MTARSPPRRSTNSWALVPVARRIAGKYRNAGGEELDDLFQVACVGLVKAIDGYDPAKGHAFLSYAVPTITGELKRHLRNRTGLVRLPRTVQEAGQQVRRARRELEQTCGGRPPTLAELAEACGLTEDAVAEAIRSQDVVRPRSLDASSQGAERPLPTFGQGVGSRDPGIEAVAERLELINALRHSATSTRRSPRRQAAARWQRRTTPSASLHATSWPSDCRDGGHDR